MSSPAQSSELFTEQFLNSADYSSSCSGCWFLGVWFFFLPPQFLLKWVIYYCSSETAFKLLSVQQELNRCLESDSAAQVHI